MFDENEGWLLCRRHKTGTMGLVPATYIELIPDAALTTTTTTVTDPPPKRAHRREPTLGGDEEAAEPLVPQGPQESLVRKGTHRREPTFEFEEGGGATHTLGGEGGRAPSFEFGAGGQQGGKRGKVIYGMVGVYGWCRVVCLVRSSRCQPSTTQRLMRRIQRSSQWRLGMW